MSETDVKLWTALVAAVVSLVVAIVTHLSSRSNQKAIEGLRDRYAESKAERDARRDYQYEARKRLYHECGPILFQLAELSEAAFYRITGLAQTASQGNLEPGRHSFLRDEYYRVSTIYRLLAPSAALKLLQQRLTLVDLSLDYAMHRQYTLVRQAFFAFGDEFTFARLGPHPLEYKPFDEKADSKARTEPGIYFRQGLPIGAMEPAIEALIAPDQGTRSRVMTYAECEAEYNKEGTRVRDAFDEIGFLIQDFHPRMRPVLWRMLVTQACLYRVLSQSRDLERSDWGIADLRMSAADQRKFDWRAKRDDEIDEATVLDPLVVAEHYLEERLIPRLPQVAPTEH
ncbi:MAG: hypothetical protein NTW28_25035 [Candidatus Solibacter sp.]|nr:hypothetical protein [Candidatus Solibacter sp.]